MVILMRGSRSFFYEEGGGSDTYRYLSLNFPIGGGGFWTANLPLDPHDIHVLVFRILFQSQFYRMPFLLVYVTGSETSSSTRSLAREASCWRSNHWATKTLYTEGQSNVKCF